VWVRKLPPEVAIAFAARMALRVLPIVWTARGEDFKHGFFADIILPVFRATNVAFAAAKYPAQATRRQATSASAGADAAAAAAPAAPAAAAAAAADSAFAAAAAAVASANAACPVFWAAVSDDATHVEEGATASFIAGSPLWPKGQPDELRSMWVELNAALRTSGEDWDVWIDWYEARLQGKGSNQKLEIARAMIPNEIWREGPAKVNAEIKRLIEKHKSPAPPKKELPLPVVTTLPVPIENVPTAVSFGWSSRGTIAVVSGAFNWPVFSYGGGDQDHKNRLEACRVLAADIARSIRSGRWNA
jgi:hypothetical protein